MSPRPHVFQHPLNGLIDGLLAQLLGLLAVGLEVDGVSEGRIRFGGHGDVAFKGWGIGVSLD